MESVSIVVRAWREAGELRVRVQWRDGAEGRAFAGADRALAFVAELVEAGTREGDGGGREPQR